MSAAAINGSFVAGLARVVADATDTAVTNNTSPLDVVAGEASESADGVEPGVFTFEFVVHGVLILVVGLLGLVGNIACLAVLSLPGMKNTINCLLTGLVIVDIVILLSAFTLFTLPAFQVREREWSYLPFV